MKFPIVGGELREPLIPKTEKKKAFAPHESVKQAFKQAGAVFEKMMKSKTKLPAVKTVSTENLSPAEIKLEQLREAMVAVKKEGHEIVLRDKSNPKRRIDQKELNEKLLLNTNIVITHRKPKGNATKVKDTIVSILKREVSRPDRHKEKPIAAGRFIYSYLAPQLYKEGKVKDLLNVIEGWQKTGWGKQVSKASISEKWDGLGNHKVSPFAKKMELYATPDEVEYGSIPQAKRIGMILKGEIPDLPVNFTKEVSKNFRKDIAKAYQKAKKDPEKLENLLEFGEAIAAKYGSYVGRVPRKLNAVLEDLAEKVNKKDPGSHAVASLKLQLNRSREAVDLILKNGDLKDMPKDLSFSGKRGLLNRAFEQARNEPSESTRYKRLRNLLRFAQKLTPYAEDAQLNRTLNSLANKAEGENSRLKKYADAIRSEL